MQSLSSCDVSRMEMRSLSSTPSILLVSLCSWKFEIPLTNWRDNGQIKLGHSWQNRSPSSFFLPYFFIFFFFPFQSWIIKSLNEFPAKWVNGERKLSQDKHKSTLMMRIVHTCVATTITILQVYASKNV